MKILKILTKRILPLLLLLLLFAVGACNGSPAEKEGTSETTKNEQTDETGNTTEKKDNDVDVDLTAMSSTMAYSQSYYMVSEPEKYVGKTVKVKGPYAIYYNDTEEGREYFPAVLVADFAGCCGQGFEFLLQGQEFPNGYPTTDCTITIVGRFETYDYLGDTFVHLVDCEMIEQIEA